jgi:hypothetical protein
MHPAFSIVLHLIQWSSTALPALKSLLLFIVVEVVLQYLRHLATRLELVTQ